MLVDERDQRLILFEQFHVDTFSESKLYAEFDAEVYRQVLSQAKKLATSVWMPSNAKGDTDGCILTNGKVSVPKSFHDLWRKWNEGGWRGLDLPREIGGLGMPMLIGMAANEYFDAANAAFQTLAAMTRGTVLLIANRGTEDQKKKYMQKILSGKWTGTMVMTEADAGTDLGATKTKAQRNKDGTYSISGSKMLITGGDTDLTENIIHFVLARVNGAPAGTSGLSLFVVPKIRINPDGSLGEPNDVRTISIEKKLGLNGSPTCHLNFGEEGNCIGELVGEENRGLAVFFTTINESRLISARHGAAIASAAYLHALAYARERLQGKDIQALKDSYQVPIIRHPDVRRMLLQMKAYTEGIRILILYATYCIDRGRMAITKEEKQEWERRTSFLTPVAKAYGSDMGFRVTETAMQVYGGYGYIKDYPVEQFLRDAKAHSLFEGTNGVQALTLALRNLSLDAEGLFTLHLNDIDGFCRAHRNHPTLASYIEILEIANKALFEVSRFFVSIQKQDLLGLALYASPYLELFGDVTVGWLLMWQALIAHERLMERAPRKRTGHDKTGPDTLAPEDSAAPFYRGKLASARYFASTVLSQATPKAQAILKMDRAALEIADNAF
jgi:alkylation response protein AidB-like acyl-CoA dehydrogenase